MDGSLVERFNALLNRPRSDETSRNQEVYLRIFQDIYLRNFLI